MSITRAYLSLGSNIGDRLANLALAIRAMSEAGHRPSGADARALLVTAVSPVYETTPLGPGGAILTEQRAYFNCAAEIACALSANALLWMTKGIEAAMGRVHGERCAPRPVDIDLLLFGNVRVDTPELRIPHPHMLERAFVLRPLLDIAPALTGADGQPLSSFFSAVASQGCAEAVTREELWRRAGLDATCPPSSTGG